MENNNRFYVPPNTELGKALHFDINNVDLRIDTTCGENEFHKTQNIIIDLQIAPKPLKV